MPAPYSLQRSDSARRCPSCGSVDDVVAVLIEDADDGLHSIDICKGCVRAALDRPGVIVVVRS